jgi:excisionase family DNA binding protein
MPTITPNVDEVRSAPAVIAQSEDSLLRPAEAARELGVCLKTLYNLMRDGRLPSVKVAGARRVQRSDLSHFIDQQRQVGWANGGGEVAAS